MAKFLDENGAAYLINKILILLNNKIDKEEGKSLSEENFTTLLKTKLENLEDYSLPIANDQTLGGIKVGLGLTIDSNGKLSVSSLDWENIINKPDIITNQEIDMLFEE